MTDLPLWIRERLDLLNVGPFILIGCPRRNVWSRVWRSDVGVGVCALVGRRCSVVWEGRTVDFYMTPDMSSLLLWRGGPWRDWWEEDAFLFVGMIRAQSNIRATGTYLLHEVDGRTSVRHIETPAGEAESSYTEVMSRWKSSDVPPRMKRDTERAKAQCFRCPVRNRCEATDMESGDTHDWLK